MPVALPRPPVVLEKVLDDPTLVPDVVKRGGPYWTVQRYVQIQEELASLGVREVKADAPMFIAPWFRGDWAHEEPLVEGLGPIFANPRFLEAARALFGGEIVVPKIVYANLMTPMPAVDPGHLDVPAFRGFDRTQWPIWLLMIMLKSGLFDRWHIPVATAVAWYYEGAEGGFKYWPEGPDHPPSRWACRSNTAIVGDNEHMFHAVERVGDDGTPPLMGLTLDSRLRWSEADDQWQVVEGDEVLRTYPYEALRLSVSWKAQVFADERARRVVEEHEDDLDETTVRRVFLDDLRQKGLDVEEPEDLATDPAFMKLLNGTYAVGPTVFR